jgi:hypothetical protein
MFARGVETIVSDHLNHPRKHEASQTSEKQPADNKKEPSGNFFNLLMRQFASY